MTITTKIDINSYIKECAAAIEHALDRLVPAQECAQKNLFTAARYSLLGGGKRIRPILAIATAEALGASRESALQPACALEMIHTYSLIHDDLPCMDDDDIRRGKPSLHRAFPEGLAVLAGDYLLTYAFEVICNAKHLSTEQRLTLVKILSDQSGGHGMIAGQVMDIEAEGKSIDLAQLKETHRCKTGALLLASIEFGATIANASTAQLQVLRKFGEDIGLAYQIIDDVLDVTASKQKHGKDIGSDILNNKATYVTLLGLEKSKALAQKLFNEASQSLNSLNVDTALLLKLAELIVNRTS